MHSHTSVCVNALKMDCVCAARACACQKGSGDSEAQEQSKKKSVKGIEGVHVYACACMFEDGCLCVLAFVCKSCKSSSSSLLLRLEALAVQELSEETLLLDSLANLV